MKNLLKKKLNKKGFTLAELLIVIAIIAVLVAIAIPVFSSAIGKAEAAVQDANFRSAKSQAALMYMAAGESTTKYYDYKVDAHGNIMLTAATGTPTEGSTDKTTGVVVITPESFDFDGTPTTGTGG